jgi:hypothetical protein
MRDAASHSCGVHKEQIPLLRVEFMCGIDGDWENTNASKRNPKANRD